MKLLHGDLAAQLVSERIGEPVATVAALGALPNSRCVNGQVFYVLADGSRWQFNTASALTADNILVAGAATGRFLRMPGAAALELPITFATADAAVLLTMQAGQKFQLANVNWKVTTNWTGGASSTIGVSSNKTNFTTKGDLLGGAAGSTDAALTTTIGDCFGTIGVGFDTWAKVRLCKLRVADTVRHDKITSAHTAGVAMVVLTGVLEQNLGA